ncbi:MAG: CBS domain-containing protein [Deltaproteobacteria bacterium]|nr:CBS domain-containing protein [Deltaproteobacteria bacterium]
MQIVTTHKNTDFDALASVIAATLIFQDALAVLPKNLNPNVKAFLSIHKELFLTHTAADVDLKAVDRLIVVDVNSWSRLDRMEALKDRNGIEVLLWDHHTGTGSIRPSWSCIEPVGAATTLMVRELKKKRKPLTPMQATLLLAGIYEDTGNLTFPSTTSEDAHAAGWLLERKADLLILSTFLKPAYSEKHKAILSQMLQNAERSKIKGHRISINKVNIAGHVDSLAVVVRMAMEILNVDAAFGIFSEPGQGRCMVIGRGQAEGLDVGSIMRSMGGGGHPRAGSAHLKAVHPDAVEQWIRELIQGNQQSSVQISDLMSFPVSTVCSQTTMEEVAMMLRNQGITGIPVVDDGRIVGMVSRRDFRRVRKDSQLKSTVKAFMSKEVLTIAPGNSPMQAAAIMVKHDVGRLPVVDDGRVIGILTRSDVMRFFYDLLPD